MRMDRNEAWSRVEAAHHGVLATRHQVRGVDLVPVVFVMSGDRQIFVPIDTVKQKTTTRLQRLDNLAYDPRCSLLVEHYDADWTRLWWVRISGTGTEAAPDTVADNLPRLADRYPQYAEPGSIGAGIIITPTTILGWQAS
jgi:PPOX class probable F420-dependent enzyme